MISRDNFCQFCIKPFAVTPHPNRVDETIQMRGHNIRFRREIRKIIIKYSLLSRVLNIHQNLQNIIVHDCCECL